MDDSSILLAYLILITVISAKIIRWKTGTKAVSAGRIHTPSVPKANRVIFAALFDDTILYVRYTRGRRDYSGSLEFNPVSA
jgi:hypothetical protein